MAQAQVSNTIRDLNGHALAQTVTVDIAPIGAGPFITPEGNELVGPLSFQTDKAGNWTQGIERTDTLSPQGTLFLVTEHLPSGRHTYKIAVPGPGPYRISDPGIIQPTAQAPISVATASLPLAFSVAGGPLQLFINTAGGISSGSSSDRLGGAAGVSGALRDRGGQVFNILEYGGASDVGLQGAYTAAIAGNGGTILVPSGVQCVIQSTINVLSHKQLDFKLEAGAKLLLANGNRPIFAINQSVDTIPSTRITGGVLDIAGVVGGVGVRVTDTTAVALEDMYINCNHASGSLGLDFVVDQQWTESLWIKRVRIEQPAIGVQFRVTPGSPFIANPSFAQMSIVDLEVDLPLTTGVDFGPVNITRGHFECIVWLNSTSIIGSRAAYKIAAAFNGGQIFLRVESSATGTPAGLYFLDIVDSSQLDLLDGAITAHQTPWAAQAPYVGYDHNSGASVLQGVHNPGNRQFRFNRPDGRVMLWPAAATAQDMARYCAPDGTPYAGLRMSGANALLLDATGEIVVFNSATSQRQDIGAKTFDASNGLTLPGGSLFTSHNGTPEGVVAAGVGSLCTDFNTGAVYRKTSGNGNTGWVTP